MSDSAVTAEVKGTPVGWGKGTATGSGVAAGGRSVPVGWGGLTADGDGAVWLLSAKHPVKAVKARARERISLSGRSWLVCISCLVLKVRSGEHIPFGVR